MYLKITKQRGIPRGYAYKLLLMMKLTTIILIGTLLQVSAASFGQRMSMQKSSASLKEIFREIKSQTGYNVVWDAEQLKDAKRVSANFKNAELVEVLKSIMKNQPLDYTISDRTVVIKRREASLLDKVEDFLNRAGISRYQDLRGRVVDENGQPLVGATVKVKSLNKFTKTNEQGEFSLQGVEEGAVLEISFLGYKVREVKAAANIGNVSLEISTGELEEVEVVSTGYQTLPKERATGSFTVIDSKLLNQQLGGFILDRLPAVANGVLADYSTGSEGKLMVRGLSTIRGPREPLVILDNFPYEGDIRNINPNDVESVTLLKDAAAASIWGARAGNGVIVITTKSGKFSSKLKVDITANIQLSPRPDLGRLNLISGTDLIEVERYLFNEGYYNDQVTSVDRPGLSPAVELMLQSYAGLLSEPELEASLGKLAGHSVLDDYKKYVYQESLNQQVALGLSGGTEKSSWRFSSGYDGNKGSLDEEFRRLNVKYSHIWKPISRMVISVSSTISQGSTTAGRAGFGQMGRGGFLPYARLADETGNPAELLNEHRVPFLDTLGGGRLLDWGYYPLAEQRAIVRRSRILDVLVNTGVRYDLPFGFSVDVKYQFQRQRTAGRDLFGADSYYARNMVNRFTVLGAGNTITFGVPKGAIADFSENDLSGHNFRGQINLNRDFGRLGDHDFHGLMGLELRSTQVLGNASRLYGYDPEVLTFGRVDLLHSQPLLIQGYPDFIPPGNSLSGRLNRYISVFANTGYTYRGRYGLSLSVRRDASNLFGVNVNDNWNPLWSAGLSWEISKEKFYTVSWLAYLRFRATYGFSGNTDPAMAAVTTIRYGSNSAFTQGPTASFVNYRNPELKWETAGMFNLAADFSAINGRISGSVEYYRKKGKDLFGPFPVDYTSGVGTTILKNVAQMAGDGLDLQLNSKNIIVGKFSWESSLVLNMNKDRVTKYYGGDRSGSAFVGQAISGLEGKPVYAVFGYRWAGLDPQTGDPRGFLDGEISKDYDELTGEGTTIKDLTYHGPSLPQIFGSLGNTFSFGKLSIDLRLMYQAGHYFHAPGLNYGMLYDSWVGHSEFARRWQKHGDELSTNVPAFRYPNNWSADAFYTGSDALVMKADQIRVQYVNLVWQFSSNLQIIVNASELGVVWRANSAGIDPQYYRLHSLVPPPTYALGIRANF